MRRTREGKVDKDFERELGKWDRGTLMTLDDKLVSVARLLEQSASYVTTAHRELKKLAGAYNMGRSKELLDMLEATVEDLEVSSYLVEEYSDIINDYLDAGYERDK